MINVSIFIGGATNIYNAQEASVGSILEAIRTGGSIKGIIEAIRHDPIGNKVYKKQLPVIMWQGLFGHRADAGLRSLSSLMCIDIDHKTAEELVTLRSRLIAEPWVVAIFKSPSGDGLKVVVKTDNYSPAIYKNCYKQLEKYFVDSYGIKPDSNCEALSQGCFASYDPDIYVNMNPQDYHLQYDPAFDVATKTASPLTSTSTYVQPQLTPVDMFLSHIGNGLSDEDVIEIADKRFAPYSRRYQDGNRTKSIFVQAGTLCKAGIPLNKAIAYLKEHYLPTGYDEQKLEYEISRAYEKNGSLFGTERGNYRP